MERANREEKILSKYNKKPHNNKINARRLSAENATHNAVDVGFGCGILEQQQ